MGGTLSNGPILQKKKLRLRYIRELTKDTKLVSDKNRIGSICRKHGASRVFSLVFASARKIIQGRCLTKRTLQKENIYGVMIDGQVRKLIAFQTEGIEKKSNK